MVDKLYAEVWGRKSKWKPFCSKARRSEENEKLWGDLKKALSTLKVLGGILNFNVLGQVRKTYLNFTFYGNFLFVQNKSGFKNDKMTTKKIHLSFLFKLNNVKALLRTYYEHNNWTTSFPNPASTIKISTPRLVEKGFQYFLCHIKKLLGTFAFMLYFISSLSIEYSDIANVFPFTNAIKHACVLFISRQSNFSKPFTQSSFQFNEMISHQFKSPF